MTTTVVPVLIETHGKQAYLFDTGKRRESVGASELVDSVPRWARNFVTAHTGLISHGARVEVLVAASGTFLAFCQDAELARAVVTEVTSTALRKAPGLGVIGVVGTPFDWDTGGAAAAVAQVFQRMGEVRANSPSPLTRFPVLPITALCPSSALPIAGFARVGKEFEPRSAVSLAKLATAGPAFRRLADECGQELAHVRAAAERLEGNQDDSPERVAIVHADGNGLGAVVTNLGAVLVAEDDPTPDTTYAAAYRGFSHGLAKVAHEAFRRAVARVTADIGKAPDVLPLVLGGDDLTFVADAPVAPSLTRTFLTEFVRAAAANPAVAEPLRRCSPAGDPRLGIAAGLVIVPPHFPFTAGYALAEGLLSELAKRAKITVIGSDGHPLPCVSLAMHEYLDSTPGSVERLLANLTVGDSVLTAAPYVEIVNVSDVDRRPSEATASWLAGRGLDELWGLAEMMTAVDDDGRRVLPSAQLHDLRARLRPDPQAAQEYWRRLLATDDKRWRPLAEDDDSLFTRRNGEPATTRLLDALTFAPFLASEQEGSR